MMRLAVLSWTGIALAACAQGQANGGGGNIDAKTGGKDSGGVDSGGVDSSGGHVDAPVVTPDGPPSGSCGSPFSGVLTTYSFTGATGSQASTAAGSSTSGVTAGNFTRSSALTASSGANSINSTGWPSGGSPDPTKYYTFTLSPPHGCSLTVTSIAIDVKASTSGPAAANVASDVDNFQQSAVVSTSAPSTPALSIAGITSSVEVRVFGYSAPSSAGTMRVQNTLTVNGSLQ